MKNKVFMYLFIFALLLVLFQYMSSKRIFETYETKLKKLEAKEVTYKDSIVKLTDELDGLKLFRIEYNDDALEYFENKGINSLALIPFIKDELYKLNVYEGDDHPIVPYASMTGNKMLINNVQILNHKWLIANFSDGKYWGEMMVSYEVIDGKELKFSLDDYTLYR